MAQSVRCRRVSHTNVVVENFDEAVAFLGDVYGGVVMMDLPGPNWHACLIEVGNLIIEMFEPKNFLLHGRIGPHYLGIEYEADVNEARAAVADHDVRIIRDLDVAIHTDPATSLGADYEFWGGSFYGPEAAHVSRVSQSDEHWAAHPIGYAGLIGVTHAVPDIEAASAFLQSFLGARPVYEVARESIGARAIGLQIAEDICELVTPTGDGILMQEMLTTGRGIRSTIYRVKDVGATRAWFESKGLRVIDGTAPGSIAVDPRDNLGILFEFQV
jgi:catechol 2,3-dioxygenase-like lactoylglutathione lyase family enzyme